MLNRLRLSPAQAHGYLDNDSSWLSFTVGFDTLPLGAVLIFVAR